MSVEITLPLYANLESRKLIGSEGGSPELPNFVLGDKLTCQLRLYEEVENNLTERVPNVRTLRASLGTVLTAPTSGTFSLGSQTAASAAVSIENISFDESASSLLSKTAPLGWVDAAYSVSAGVWTLRTTFALEGSGAAEPPEITVSANSLDPASFIRVRRYGQGGVHWFEIRLIQTPLAFTGSHERVLPPAPSVKEIQVGGSGSADPNIVVNEIQAFTLPPDFRGTYALTWNFRQTALLGIDDGPDEIAAALNAMWNDGEVRFKVTFPENNKVYIEFVGDLSNAPWPLIVPVVKTFDPGVLTFTLDLATAELASALRATAEIKVPLEIELEVVPDNTDPTDPTVQGKILTVCQETITVEREQIWPELEGVANIDWLRPPTPRDYIPFAPGQVITGQQSYLATFGDGATTSFSFAHNLGTDDFSGLIVRENALSGRVYTQNQEFTARAASENELLLDFAVPPSANGLRLILTTAGPKSAFQEHHHTIGEVDGLQDALDIIGQRLTNIEDLLPTGPLALAAAVSTAPEEIEVPDHYVVFPNARLGDDFDPTSLDGQNNAKAVAALPRPPGLLPMVKDASVTPFNTGVLPDPNPGNVYQNTGSTAVRVPGGLGRHGSFVQPGDYIAHDGRVWFRTTRGSVTSTSFFPTDFEEEMCPPLTFEPDTWRAGQTVNLEFDLAAALFRSNSNAQWLLIIEHGTTKSETDPTGTAIDLTSAGSGTNTIYYDGEAIGIFIANAAADTLTLAAHGLANGDIVQVGNVDGALPAGLAANTDYVVRDAATNTFKLCALTTTINLRDVVWNSKPLLAQRLTISQLKQKRHFGCRILRGKDNTITANQFKTRAWTLADSAPRTPRFALRVRLIDFDTENAVTAATGYAFAAFTGATANIT